MPKTKSVKSSRSTSARRRAVAVESPAVAKQEKLVGCSDGTCLLCWVFKLMVIVFLTMLLFWIGFSFGIASHSSYGFNKMGWDSNFPNFSYGNEVCGIVDGLDKTDTTVADPSMDHAMHEMTTALSDKTGEEFDREFAIQMIVHHEGAVEMARQALEKSSDPEVRALAEKIIETQNQEIEQMKLWQ